ncbi:MAG TPA: acyltransferase [Chitinophagaceae bacterium]|jgi:peptidoglycan/LPS O-acetylase OafA/YrhL|nr:acyltransferase [Chitinophagaceae bacterium]
MMKKESKVFFTNLDGLRFFCFLSVFLFHSFATDYQNIKASGSYHFIKGFLVANGNLGVNFFFVLSGFLITYLLFSEKEKYRKISVGNFYIRRILRIWPLFYFCVFFGFVIFPILKRALGQVPSETAHPLSYLFFLNNIDFIKTGLPDSSELGVLWSVAIEEQFYLVWPILIALIPRTRIRFVFLFIILSTFCFRFYYHNNPLILEFHTFSCISDMAVGGYFAYLCMYNNKFMEKLKVLKKVWLALLYVFIVIIFLFRKQLFGANSFLLAADRLLISLLFALVIVEQNYAEKSFFKMSNYKLISRWGVYTYGLYCLHMIGILIVNNSLALAGLNKNIYEVVILGSALCLLITLLLAYGSYHLFEKHFLKMKEKFQLIATTNTFLMRTKPVGFVRRGNPLRKFKKNSPVD